MVVVNIYISKLKKKKGKKRKKKLNRITRIQEHFYVMPCPGVLILGHQLNVCMCWIYMADWVKQKALLNAKVPA